MPPGRPKKVKTLTIDGVPVVVLTQDTLMNLLERVIKLEDEVSKLHKEDESLLESIGHWVPRLEKEIIKFPALEDGIEIEISMVNKGDVKYFD